SGKGVMPAPLELPLSKLSSLNGQAVIPTQDIVDLVGISHKPQDVVHGIVSEIMNEFPIALLLCLFLTTPDNETVTVETVDPKYSRLDRQRGKPKPRSYRRIRLGALGTMHLEAVHQHREE